MRRKRCQTGGCGRRALWVIRYRNRLKKVCTSCRDEMIGVFGWNLYQSLD